MSRFKDPYRRLVATQMLGESVVIYPLYSIMFGERSHISAAGVGTLLALWQITQILAELPTGIIADKYSKKYSIILGKIGKMLCFAVWFLHPNFKGYLAGFVLWGIGEAFTSGAVQAYLYELEMSKNQQFLKKFSRLKALTMASYAVTYFITFLIGPKYQPLIGISVLTMLATVVLAASLPHSKPKALLNTKQILSEAKTTITKSKLLTYKFIRGLTIAGAIGMLIELIVVNYRDYGVPSKNVPLLISASTLINAAIFRYLHHYENFVRRHYISTTVVMVLIFIAMYPLGLWAKVFGLFLIARYMRVLDVILESDLIHGLPDNSRATVMSAYSLFKTLLAAGLIFAVGLSAINNSIVLPTAIVTVVSCAAYVILSSLRSRMVGNNEQA